jgi:NADH dehydrogenase
MTVRRIVVLGGGFAGLWSAVGAARKLDELGVGSDAIQVTLVNRDAFHSIRVRNYESDLTPARVPLDDVLGPIGVDVLEGEVDDIDPTGQAVSVVTSRGRERLAYDRLVFALGSQLVRPQIPGCAGQTFDVDTYRGAVKLHDHLRGLSSRPEAPGKFTAVVVGAGLTGIETACELPARLRAIMARAVVHQPVRVILADHNPLIGSDMGTSARPVIEEALNALGIEQRMGVKIVAITPEGVKLDTGEEITAATVIWCAGIRANPLTRCFGVELDRLGRIPVDEFLRIQGIANAFAAGDSAVAMMDDCHSSVMSCQHGRPMGRFAGHNVVADLLGLPMRPLRIDWYTTVLDLGPWGAVYTEGWDRQVVAKGEAAKQTKQIINGQRIYPPLNRDRQAILDAAAPVVQSPPHVFPS